MERVCFEKGLELDRVKMLSWWTGRFI